MEVPLLRRVLAEFLGTAMLVLFGAGSVVAAFAIGGGSVDYAGLGIIALAFALVVALAIYTLGTTSGAHINPAVTIALAAVGRFRWAEVAPYVAAQLAGGVAGALLIVAYVGDRATDFGGVGVTTLGGGVSVLEGMVAEALGTFLLMFTIMAVAVDGRAPAGWAGFLIGLAVAAEIMVIGPFTGGSVNPARSFGPYVVNDLFGGSSPWVDFWVYVVGPVVGAGVAAFSYELLARPVAAVPPIGPSAESGTPAAEMDTGTPGSPGSEVPTPRRGAAGARSRSKT
ncbi:MIP/aquaporin family protein [Nocardioides mesophilus]|uniref:Aquaporin family protein n=1 Tax=Nocardioides mesophilus TaxID=433659 RepID=A0A7G9RCP9_9ACTN|nr:MIP/aquaporin family protein [Nocardioides mesophilus]QNN53374.1 aquaporin family protein [Nocardioides mesophilus]